MTHTLIDTGPLVAMLDQRDGNHAWTVEQTTRLYRPFFTCEPVITEAFHLLRHYPAGRNAILEMVKGGVLQVRFRLSQELNQVLALIRCYASIPMSLADGCLVRMSELVPESVVLTLDSDFRVYGGNRRQKIPLLIPRDV